MPSVESAAERKVAQGLARALTELREVAAAEIEETACGAAGITCAQLPVSTKPLARLRKFCLALPEAHEVEAWGEPTFRVRNKIFAMYANGNNHHGDGRDSVWCKSTHVTQDLLVHTHPERFFVPPYVGPSGWVGIWLDRVADWDALMELLEHSYRLIAPKRLLTQLDNPTPPRRLRSEAR
jgi:predicted DNA-binding protein (MmcQ/YjbR family)